MRLSSFLKTLVTVERGTSGLPLRNFLLYIAICSLCSIEPRRVDGTWTCTGMTLHKCNDFHKCNDCIVCTLYITHIEIQSKYTGTNYILCEGQIKIASKQIFSTKIALPALSAARRSFDLELRWRSALSVIPYRS